MDYYGKQLYDQNVLEDQEMADILTLGELLIDLTEKGKDENGSSIMVAYPGGAPANVAVAASRLGSDASFVGKVGNDSFGKFLKKTMEDEGVNTDGLYLSDEYQTTLAIVAVGEDGDREFSFYRSPGADTQLTPEEALDVMEKNGVPSIMHIGSLSLTTSPAKEACEEAVRYAKENGSVISYDPNYRPVLWESEDMAVSMMKLLLPDTDIVKVAEEEMVLLTGSDDCEEASRILSENGIKLVIITLGGEGVFVRYGDFTEKIPGEKTTVVDTNGAGDTFLGAMLARLAGRKAEGKSVIDDITPEELVGYVRYANKAAAITCSRPGAIPAMPKAEEMNQ